MKTPVLAALQLKKVDKVQNIIAISSLVLIVFSLYHLRLEVKKTKMELKKLEGEHQ